MSAPPPSLAVLVSGRGSNLQAILAAIREQRLPARVVAVIGDRAAPARDLARAEGIPFLSPGGDEELCAALRERGVQWVALAGYLHRIGPRVLAAYPNRVLNIHPSLLPAFGGQGMYGQRVHRAVLAAGVRETGASVHIVTEDYDQGPVLARERVAVLPGDSPESLAARVLAVEHRLYPDTLARLVRGELRPPPWQS